MREVPPPRKPGEWTRETLDDARSIARHWWVLLPALAVGLFFITRTVIRVATGTWGGTG